MHRPLARSWGVSTVQVGAALFVYDHDGSVRARLEEVTVAVWQGCDGHASVPELVKGVAARIGRAVDVEDIHDALYLLDDAGLLDHSRWPDAAAPLTTSAAA